jgi:tetratricopeptide (TPR) repeat protein
MDAEQLLERAGQHHHAGRLAEARALYHQIVARQPQHAEALHRLGMLAHQAGEHDAAADFLARAIAARPSEASYHNDLGIVRAAEGRLAEAAAEYRAAIFLQPDFSRAHSNLGVALRMLGRFKQAIAAYREAIRCEPDSAEPHYNLGNLYRDQDQTPAAIECYQAALRLHPEHLEAWHNLGLAYRATGREDEAIEIYRHVLQFKPGSVETLLNLGNVFNAQGRLEEALAIYGEAIALAPDLAEGHNGLAVALTGLGRFAEADAANARARHCQPNDPEARLNHAMRLLSRGEYREGWALYEARWTARSTNLPRLNFSQPEWDGRPLQGERILVHAEQGFGDSIQFVRYVPRLAEMGGRVVLSCPEPLVDLLRGVRGVAELVADGEPRPPFDLHAGMMSLPRIFGTIVETIPAEVPYITADRVRGERWRQRLERERPGLRVGLVWSGNPRHRFDHRRSLPFELVRSLLDIEGVEFCSLQRGRASADLRSLSPSLSIADWTAELETFADTAALVQNLDLVITVDTAVAHLAGALGRRVWTMIAVGPDWRWLLERTDTPWYPTMRLFRQARLGEWAPVMAEVRAELQAMARA